MGTDKRTKHGCIQRLFIHTLHSFVNNDNDNDNNRDNDEDNNNHDDKNEEKQIFPYRVHSEDEPIKNFASQVTIQLMDFCGCETAERSRFHIAKKFVFFIYL